jgi:hypothetical protein
MSSGLPDDAGDFTAVTIAEGVPDVRGDVVAH